MRHIGSVSIIVTGVPGGNGNLTDPVVLQATPVGGFGPLAVTLTPTATVPGTITSAGYDFNGDNIIDQNIASAPFLNPISHTYAAGQYFPVVTVTTTQGKFSSSGGWNSIDPDRLRINVQTPAVVQQTLTSIADPVDLKCDAAGNLYVLSRSTATITEFAAGGASTLRSLAGIGSIPQGLDVDGSGNVYVALKGDNQVAKFKPQGASFQWDTTFGVGGLVGKANKTTGTGNGEFNAPFDVAVSPDGTIIVSDSTNHRIQRFSNTGTFLGAFGSLVNGLGQLNTPKGLTCDDDGNVYIADSGNGRVTLAKSSGIILGTSGTPGTALGQFQGMVNLGVSGRGIYVAETGNTRIQVFDPLSHGHGTASTPFKPRLVLSSGLGLNWG